MIGHHKHGLSGTTSTCSSIRMLLDYSGGAPFVSVMQPAAPVSRRSGQTPAAGSVGAPEYLYPMPSEHGSDDNSPRMSGGAGIGFARGPRSGDPSTHGEAYR